MQGKSLATKTVKAEVSWSLVPPSVMGTKAVSESSIKKIGYPLRQANNCHMI